MPVYEETMDRVVGVLHQDVLPHMDSPGFDWHTLLRDPISCPGQKLDDLLTEFQRRRCTWPLWWTNMAAPAAS